MGKMLIIGHHQPVKTGGKVRLFHFYRKERGVLTLTTEIHAHNRSEARSIYKKHYQTRRVSPDMVITEITEEA